MTKVKHLFLLYYFFLGLVLITSSPAYSDLLDKELAQENFLNPSETWMTKQRSLFEDRKINLRNLGVSVKEGALEYLTLELYYNIPNRIKEVVLSPNANPRISTLKLNIENKIDFLDKNFPQALPGDFFNLKSIQIGGHDNRFVWSQNNSEIFFILKSSTSGPTNNTIVSESFALQNKSKGLIIANELKVNVNQAIRLLKVDTDFKHYKVYPLHGFLGSYKLQELAESRNQSTLELLTDSYIPKLATSFFDSSFKHGFIFPAHTQNLWLLVDQNNTFELVYKDLADVLFNPFFMKKPILDRSVKTLKLVANKKYGIDLRKAEEPWFNMALLLKQALVEVGPLSLTHQSLLFQRFILEFKALAENEFNVKIAFSKTLNSKLNDLHKHSRFATEHSFNVTVGSKRLLSPAYGYSALLSLLAEEIYTQIYSKIGKGKLYLKDIQSQKSLRELFNNSNSKSYFTPLKSTSLSYIMSPFFVYQTFIIDVLTRPVRAINMKFKIGKTHFELNKDFVFLVQNKTDKLLAGARLNSSSPLEKEFLHRYETLTKHPVPRRSCRFFFAL